MPVLVPGVHVSGGPDVGLSAAAVDGPVDVPVADHVRRTLFVDNWMWSCCRACLWPPYCMRAL